MAISIIVINRHKTSDLVKRRYSTRFNNLPPGFDPTASPVPSVPGIPTQYGASREQGRSAAPAKGPGLAVDVKALRDPNLQPEKYLASVLSDASDQDIDNFQQALQKLRNRASTDLQQNVYQNRTQFIKISKEAEKLKAEMRALRNLMSDLKTNTTALRTASSRAPDAEAENGFDSGFPTTLSKRDRRSSVADRTVLWTAQLQVRTLTF